MSKRTNFVKHGAAASLFAACFAMGMMPMGCAATDEYAIVASPQTDVTPVEQAFPEDVAAKLKSCAKADDSSLAEHSYDVVFEVQLDEDRAITEVKPNGSRLDDAQMETCMITALKELPIEFILRRQGAGPATSQLVSPVSRGLMGNTAALPQLIRLAPIVVTAPGGISIVVGVVIVTAAVAVVGKLSKECQRQWDEARRECEKWIKFPDGKRGLTGGYTNVEECARGRVDERCKGNPIDYGNQGRNGRRF